ncbi:MAG: TolC family protein [Synergistetes bacterium]|nr:TolC family protein [Synergistota bacterium]MCX8127598.1 TolC family protein [Synergistota bacterium]MDW8191485.1 TolC family protein [Synergistota bacterium]
MKLRQNNVLIIGFILSLTLLHLLGHLTYAKVIKLNEAINLALSNNPAIKEAEAKVRQAEGELQSARAGLFPKLKFESSYVRINEEKAIPIFTIQDGRPVKLFSIPIALEDTFSLAVKLEWLIWGGGKVQALVNALEYGVKAAQANLEATKNNIIHETEKAYYSVLKAKAYMELMEDMVKLLEVHQDRVKKLYEKGVVPKSDLLRVGVELSNTKLGYLRAQNSFRIAKASLKTILGIKEEVEPEDVTSQPEIKLMELNQYFDIAKSKRAELLAIQRALSQAESYIRAATGNLKPSYVLSAKYGKYDSSFPPKEEEWNIALAIQWNLYDGGETKGNIEKAKGIRDELLATYKKVENNVLLGVENAYLNLESALERLEVAKKEVESAKVDYEMMVKRYNAQVASIIDVLDAQTALKEARTHLIDALYEVWISWSDLKYHCGYEVMKNEK